MATVEKIRNDIAKTKEKIAELQKKQRALEAQLAEEENLEIVRMVKAVKMDNKELTAFLKAYASGLITLPAGRGLAVCVIFKEELIHRDMIAGNKLKENLKAWMLSLIFNVGKISGREIHFVSHLVPGLLASVPCRFDCVPKGLKIIFWYWSFCHIHSPYYILLFTFLSGYVYTVLIDS